MEYRTIAISDHRVAIIPFETAADHQSEIWQRYLTLDRMQNRTKEETDEFKDLCYGENPIPVKALISTVKITRIDNNGPSQFHSFTEQDLRAILDQHTLIREEVSRLRWELKYSIVEWEQRFD
jgi:hypothetical protein